METSNQPTEYYPIMLSAIKGNYRLMQTRRRNKKFIQIERKILQRDNYTCRYCGFFSKEYQKVINVDQNYRNNKIDNLICSCSFCAQCFFIDSVGSDSDSGGMIIFLPEISQADLNNFARVLYCSLDKESPYKAKLQAVYMSLKDRSKDVETCFGPQSSDPRIFGQGLIDAKIPVEGLSHEVMKGLRLLPAKKIF